MSGYSHNKVLITGGARSGKSTFAERLCAAEHTRAWYIATAQAADDEMRERVNLHRQQRQESGYAWEICEEPLELPALLRRLATQDRVPALLIDCLTLWLSNVLLHHEHDHDVKEQVFQQVDELIAAIEAYPGAIMMVTNEVGDGIVPAYSLGRLYRDLAGTANRRVAAVCSRVFLVTAGIPVELKSREYQL
ncbi:bifunctional adenosylcobinamide kinase/adenosylcobinamide-phosphate guanylyltransferase [Paenibacillus bovis]|uniref:Adenosylcobinamide kinase n=1 Tax=Paenibacillus bovis TaxID=1616788 RepID=A0A172ZFM9_9BACL|nr:bifunctional adenosylcobinamide kinase/adenosylcobinamide-phosphate guanylyltransferase [Paenibacillus bovis]ANF96077.1 bifunctional adenosylcobinamide kinase/adenosylcobinamide-phosphate guanylyltransferase [Paenibacillus bovis]